MLNKSRFQMYLITLDKLGIYFSFCPGLCFVWVMGKCKNGKEICKVDLRQLLVEENFV